MAQWILKENGYVVPLRTILPLTTTELNSETEKKLYNFDQRISKRWCTSISPPPITIDTTTDNLHDPYEDPDKPARAMTQLFDPVENYTNKLLD